MKITKIKTQVKHIALKTPFKTALRETSDVEFVRVYVENENGHVGIGEAPATKAITGEGIEDILHSIESVKEQFSDTTCKEALELLHSGCKIGSSAKAALDMAFISLHVEQENRSLAEYFCIENFTPIKTDVTISLNAADVMMEDAKKACSERKEILKVKVGSDILHAVDVIRKIANELPNAEILVDANQAWSFEDAHFFINNMLDVKIELIEQPVVASDLESLKKITEFSHIPILADEAVFTLRDAKKVVESKSADMINIKFMKCGGVTKAIEILEYARQSGVKCMLGSMLEGPYSINMALYLAFAYRDVVKYVDLDSPLLYKEPSSELDFEFRGCEISLKK
ncbi:dipeptide epimerase [Sulfurimonas sp.]|jgi:L-alanine-DL-glutamate epimerase-like enolase superfamily enzyme|uniref:dipeptide epimerase n=1 Tax=Sulfurimonas sp. TaxID=2022749 RepID=UPI002A36E510|nr:dipeptide epimerase [Sulfurimonas sp.]MDY0122907.1 dipeptide epimerase [Sulfurimonas sp.]